MAIFLNPLLLSFRNTIDIDDERTLKAITLKVVENERNGAKKAFLSERSEFGMLSRNDA